MDIDKSNYSKVKILTGIPLEKLVEIAKTTKEPEFLKEKFKDAVLPAPGVEGEEWEDAPIPKYISDIYNVQSIDE